MHATNHAHKRREIGDHLLNARLPRISSPMERDVVTQSRVVSHTVWFSVCEKRLLLNKESSFAILLSASIVYIKQQWKRSE